MKRGRPFHSLVRQNITELLAVMNKAYGYDLHRCYLEVFPPCTRKLVYYHLRTGVKLGTFTISEIKQEHGDFSWGQSVEKIYYSLGPNAQPRGDERVNKWFEEKKK